MRQRGVSCKLKVLVRPHDPQGQLIHQFGPYAVNENGWLLNKGEEKVDWFQVDVAERSKVCCQWYHCNKQSVYTQVIFQCIFYSNILFIEHEKGWVDWATRQSDWEPEFIKFSLSYQGNLYRSYFSMPFYCETSSVSNGFYSVTAFSRCPPFEREDGNLLYKLYLQ